MSKIKTTTLSYAEVTAYDFEPPATFFIINALGDYVWLHTSKREVAQAWVDNEYGAGRYKVKASKLQKTKSKLESGGLSCTGTQSRRGQRK